MNHHLPKNMEERKEEQNLNYLTINTIEVTSTLWETEILNKIMDKKGFE